MRTFQVFGAPTKLTVNHHQVTEGLFIRVTVSDQPLDQAMIEMKPIDDSEIVINAVAFDQEERVAI